MHWAAVIALLGSLASSGEPVRIKLSGVEPGLSLVDARVQVRGVESKSELPHRFPLPLETMLPVSVFPAELFLIARGFWAAPQPVESEGEIIELKVWPTGTLHGRLEVKEGGPGSLTLRFAPGEQDQKPKIPLPAGSVACNVMGRAFSCELPAGTFDLKLEADGFIPHYAWGQELRAGTTRDLGPIRLERGSSVSGWVSYPNLPRDTAEVFDVRLDRAAPSFTGDSQLDRRLQLTERSTKTTSRGFFQLRGVDAGSYRLMASLGNAVGEVDRVEVGSGETRIPQTIVVEEPARFECLLSTPNRDWSLILSQPERGQRNVFRAAATSTFDAQGIAKFTGLRTGRYQYEVRDRHESIWQSGEVHLAAGPNPPLVLDIPAIEVLGRVLWGEEPIAANISFGEFDRVRIHVESNPDGDFEALLPREGSWPLMVETAAFGWTRNLPPVHVRQGEPLEIRLPATKLAGKVVFGKAAARGAFVAIKRRDATQRIIANVAVGTDGTFLAAGFAPGEVAVYAYGPQGDSEWHFLTITEDEKESRTVELELLERKELRGTVRSMAGPVPAAQISVVERGGAFAPWRGRGIAGMNGDFTVRLPSTVRRVDVLIGAAGFGTDIATDLDATGTAPMGFGLAAQRGNLELHGVDALAEGLVFGKGTNETNLGDVLMILEERGLLEWIDPRTVRLRDLAPGQYFLCARGRPDCARGQLADGAQLELAAPAIDHRQLAGRTQ